MPRLHLEATRRLTPGLVDSTGPGTRLEAGQHRCIKRLLVLLVALMSLSVCALAALSTRASLVEFPSSTGPNVLRLARLEVGRWFYAETYFQRTSISYWAGSTFSLRTGPGGDWKCRAGIQGWARPQALRGALLRLVCECEQPRLRNRRPSPCLQLIGQTSGS